MSTPPRDPYYCDACGHHAIVHDKDGGTACMRCPCADFVHRPVRLISTKEHQASKGEPKT